MKDIREYLGQGIKFPDRLVNGKRSLVNDKELVEQSIKIILDTPKGHRFMLPEFGSRLHELIFEPNDDVLKDLMAYFIYEAITTWEKRVQYVKTEFEKPAPDTLNCIVYYSILQSNEINSFVYPFYRKLTS